MKQGRFVQLYLFLHIAAIVNALVLLIHHFKVNLLHPTQKSFCTLNSFVDCDQVALSQFSEILQIPAASIGFFAYLTTLLISVSLLLFFKDNRKAVGFRVLQIILSLMLLFSLSEFFISIFFLQKICLLCALLYIIIIALNVLLYQLLKRDRAPSLFSFKTKELMTSHNLPLLTIFTISACIAFLTAYLTTLSVKQNYLEQKRNATAIVLSESRGNDRQLRESYKKLVQEKLPLAFTSCIGPEDAPIVLVEFSDFFCPYCAEMAKQLDSLQRKYSDSVKVCFLNFPLDSKCNPQIPNQIHEGSCLASEYAICSEVRSKFWEFSLAFFNDQIERNEVGYREWLTTHGIEPLELDECLAKNSKKRLKLEIDLGIALKITYTPTLYLNNQRISEIINGPQDIEALIEFELQKKD